MVSRIASMSLEETRCEVSRQILPQMPHTLVWTPRRTRWQLVGVRLVVA
jgi:hypothetical protein